MKSICAWCGDTIDRAGYSQTLEPGITHGMCPACYEALVSQQRGVSLQCHIDSIPIPILLLDSKDAVVAMNVKARSMLGKKLDVTARPVFGEVFDCVHSHLPEGCGRTIHCSGCVIRRSVATTFETGEPQILVPAALSVESPDQLSESVLKITAVKGEGVVFLRVEKVMVAESEVQ